MNQSPDHSAEVSKATAITAEHCHTATTRSSMSTTVLMCVVAQAMHTTVNTVPAGYIPASLQPCVIGKQCMQLDFIGFDEHLRV